MVSLSSPPRPRNIYRMVPVVRPTTHHLGHPVLILIIIGVVLVALIHHRHHYRRNRRNGLNVWVSMRGPWGTRIGKRF